MYRDRRFAMCYEVISNVMVPCPHLRGAKGGAECQFSGEPIRLMEFATIKLCLSRRHESCEYYIASLRERYYCASLPAS